MKPKYETLDEYQDTLGAIKEKVAEKTRGALTRQIANRIKEFGLTQTQAGTRLGISQLDVSKLMSGRYTGYSVDRLIAIPNALEVDVEIVIRPRSLKASRCRGSERILEVAS